MNRVSNMFDVSTAQGHSAWLDAVIFDYIYFTEKSLPMEDANVQISVAASMHAFPDEAAERVIRLIESTPQN